MLSAKGKDGVGGFSKLPEDLLVARAWQQGAVDGAAGAGDQGAGETGTIGDWAQGVENGAVGFRQDA